MLTRLSCRIARRRRFSWFSTTLVFFRSSDPKLLVRVSDSCGGREGGRKEGRKGGREGEREGGREGGRAGSEEGSNV